MSEVASTEHYDVVVVGAGGAGLAAAIEARATGARVLLLEKNERPGGSTSWSIGSISSSQTPHQRKRGIADTPADAANLRMRSELMRRIAGIISDSGWTQAEAARRCGVSQPRISDLLRGRISRFSLDALVNMASTLGWKVSLQMKAA